VEYEQRIEALEKVEYPKPLGQFLYDLFDVYRVAHPWAADHNIKPKSVVRDLYQRAMGFGDYVAHYGIARSEGLLLRYLSDSYKSLTRAIPEDSKTDELIDLTEWLGELVRQVDSSLLDEWELLRNPPPGVAAEHAGALMGAALAAAIEDPSPPPVTANRRAFRIMVANAVGGPGVTWPRSTRIDHSTGRPPPPVITPSRPVWGSARRPGVCCRSPRVRPLGRCARCSTTPTATGNGVSRWRWIWPPPMTSASRS
jgi:superfamily II RNA helicase